MTNEMNIDKLSELFAQIERAWLDHRDRRMVRDLSEKYPEFRDELCEFFEDLVLGPGTPTDEMAKAENRVSEWLSSTGLDIAAAAVTSARSSHGTTTASLGAPSSIEHESSKAAVEGSDARGSKVEHSNWLFFLRKRTKQTVPCIARALTNVTAEYLVLVSRHPDVVPVDVKTHIAQEVENNWGISVQESFQHLFRNPSLVRAASRSEPFKDNPKTFNEILDRAALTEEQKSYWLRYSKESK